MRRPRRKETRALRAAFVLSLGFAFAAPAFAQQPFPSRPIRIVVPFSAGGGGDAMRTLVRERQIKLDRGYGEYLNLQ